MRVTRSRTSAGPRRFIGGAAISANRTAPSLRTLSVSKSIAISFLLGEPSARLDEGIVRAHGPVSCSLYRAGSVAIRGQERCQRRQQLLWRLLGDPVAAFGDDDTLHVVGDELHRADDAFADALSASNRKNRERQTAHLALSILRNGRVDRPV